MKRLTIWAAAALTMICASSCRFIKLDESKFGGFDDLEINIGETGTKGTIKGSEKTTTINYSDLDKIVLLSIDGSTDINIRQSENTELSLELPENLEEYLRFDYGASACRIYLDKDYKYTNARFDIVLGTSDLETLEINGAAELEMSRMQLGDLSIEFNGAGDLDMNHIKCGNLSIEINGAGEVDAQEMDSKDIDIEINGAADLDLGGKCANVEIEVNGTGSVDLSRMNCSGKKNVKKSGLVSIKY